MNSALRYARVLTIAGSDSSAGAGIQADLKTLSALGCYGMSAITALTAQNTTGVQATHPVPADVLKAQIASVVTDIGVDAVKIGMLPNVESVAAVAWAIDHHALTPVVLDPVMVASSGDRLMADAATQALVGALFPRASLVTPNLDEASLFLGRVIDHDVPSLQAAAEAIVAMGARAVLLKGGHMAGDTLVDVLVQADGNCHSWTSPRIASANTHGTGCTLSSAIAAQLALGHALVEAVDLARAYVRGAISHGADVRTGHGHGPLNHGFAPLPWLKQAGTTRHPS